MEDPREKLAPDVFEFMRAVARKMNQPMRFVEPIIDEAFELAFKSYRRGYEDDQHERPTLENLEPVAK